MDKSNDNSGCIFFVTAIIILSIIAIRQSDQLAKSALQRDLGYAEGYAKALNDCGFATITTVVKMQKGKDCH